MRRRYCRFVGLHVVVPVLALVDVARIELPVLVRIRQALHQARLLLFPGDVQEEFQNNGAVGMQVPL